MVMKKAIDLKIICKTCKEEVDVVKTVLTKIDNEWDTEDSTGWVSQKLAENNLGVMTHTHIQCPNKKCKNYGKDVAILKLDFVSNGDAELIF